MRTRTALLVAALAAALVLGGCAPAKVKVETGERVMCRYGHLVSEDVKVVEVPADRAGDYSVVTRTITCPRHAAIELLYAEAQAAIQAGDLKAARADLLEVVKQDPSFRRAARQVEQIAAGKKPAPDTTATPAPSPAPGGGPGGTPGGTEGKVPVGPIKSLTGWVPDTLTGFRAEPILADAMQVTREYVATGGGPIESLAIVVEQYKSPQAAAAAIPIGIGRDYPVGWARMAVEGRTAYFGTDGSRFAVIAWNEGALLIVVEGSSRDRRPALLADPLSDVVRQLAR